jgi:predicted amidohydrolase YtcJ
MRYTILVILLIFILLISCHNSKKKSDLVLINGHIVTVDEEIPEAEGIAIEGENIVAVGNNEQIKSYIGKDTEVIDLQGKLAIPGFIEGHAHFMSLGYSKIYLELGRAKSWTELINIIASAVKRASPGEWIQGHGWHQEKWIEIPEPVFEGYPVHTMLSKISANNPVYLTHASGHAILVNSAAMKTSNIDRLTKDPPGGHIIRNSEGEPTGILLENAADLIYFKLEEAQRKRTPKQIENEKERAFNLAVQTCQNNGITSFQDAGASFETIDFYRKMTETKQLGVRLWVMIGEDNKSLKEHIADYKITNLGNKKLTVRSIKRFIDGALGTHGAWLFEPYIDVPNSTGLPTVSIEYLTETAEIAIENSLQLCTHAIGDRGNHEILNIYENTFKNNLINHNLRWRIEHAQHINPSDIYRFAQLGVIASMQPNHCTSDGPWVPKRLGDRRSQEGAYVWQKLIKAGAMINSGTDAPVEDINPVSNFYAAISRRLHDGTQFYPEQCMSRQQALKSFTLNCAYAAFEEAIKGSITPGKLADLTILSKNILTIPEEELLETEVLYTILGGKIVFKK